MNTITNLKFYQFDGEEKNCQTKLAQFDENFYNINIEIIPMITCKVEKIIGEKKNYLNNLPVDKLKKINLSRYITKIMEFRVWQFQ